MFHIFNFFFFCLFSPKLIISDHHHQQQQLIKQPQSQQHRLVIYTNPQKYYSIRIDQPHRQAIHILPENYQFCSLGKKFRNTLNGPEIFGTCSAKVHFGKCTDFDVFVEQEQQQQQQQPKQQKIDDYDDTATLSDCKNFIYYKIKTPTKTATPIINIGSSGGDGHNHRSITTTATNTAANDNANIPKNVRSISSSSITSILSKIESYRDNLDAAIELLTNDELDNHNQRNELEHLIR